MFLSFIRQNAKPNATTPPTAWHRMKANIPETQIKTCDVLEENVERPFSFNIFNIESSVYCFKSSSSHGVINTSILSYGSNCVWGCVCGGVHGLLDSGGLYFANELAVCHMVPVFTSLGACGIFSSGLEPPPPRFVRPPANWSMAMREEGVAFEQEDPPTSSRKSPPLCVAFPCSRLVLASSSGPGLKIRLSGSFTVSHLLLIVFDITLMACEQDGEALLIDQSYECWSV